MDAFFLNRERPLGIIAQSWRGNSLVRQLPSREKPRMIAPRTSQVGQLLEHVQRGDAAARDELIAYADDRLRTFARAMLQANPLRRGRGPTI